MMSDVRFADPPIPPSERRAWLLACTIGLLGLGALVAGLSGAVGRQGTVLRSPPPVLSVTPTPTASQPLASSLAASTAAGTGPQPHTRILTRPTLAQQRAD